MRHALESYVKGNGTLGRVSFTLFNFYGAGSIHRIMMMLQTEVSNVGVSQTLLCKYGELTVQTSDY